MIIFYIFHSIEKLLKILANNEYNLTDCITILKPGIKKK